MYLPSGLLALLARHWNHYHRHVRRPSWTALERALFILPFGFYVALGLRWIRRSLTRSPTTPPTPNASCQLCEGSCVQELILDREYPYRFSDELLAELGSRYFRSRFQGLDRIPNDGPVIIMMNHAGMAFPWDFLIFAGELMRRRGPDFPLRGPGEKIFTRNPIINHILPERWLETIGGVEATYRNLEKMVRHEQVIIYAPEGVAGMGKGWGKRYQLEPFHTSFLKLAAKYDATIVPGVCIGSENLHPWAVNVPWLAKLIGFPFFPLSFISVWLPIFPSLLVWSLPIRMDYYVDDPITLPDDDYESYTKADWQALAEQFRQDMQARVDARLKQRD